MSTSISWENIPAEIWFMVLEKLPIKSQVSLGCTCKRMYQLSLDPFLANLEQRAWVYLRDNAPLPDLLAKAITILRIPLPESTDKDLKQRNLFLQGEIRRMSNLQKLVVEGDRGSSHMMFSFSYLHEIVLQQDLVELRVPDFFFTQRSPSGKTLLHLAVEKENIKLVNSLLSQMEGCFQNEIMDAKTSSQIINACDNQGNSSLNIAREKGNEELILLLKKGARGKEHLLSRESTDLSSIIKGTIDKGSHLQIDYLSPSDYPAFFEAVAQSSAFFSLSFSKEGYREIKKTGLDFFQSLAEAVQSNFQRCAARSQGDSKSLGLFILDLRVCEELTIQEVRPFFTCLGLEELWLPTSLLDHLDEQKHNLLHLLVQESPMNKKIAGSLIAQGVALSGRDHKGRTPIELARECGFVTGSHEMAIFLEQAAKRKLTTFAFGKKDWEKYFGQVGKEPPLPVRILEVLESPCPIWPNKKVIGTHFLTLIPEKVNGKPLTLNSLQDFVNNPKGRGNKVHYLINSAIKNDYGSRPSGSSYWVLMTKSVLPHTRYISYDNQLSKLNAFSAKAPKITGLGEYKTPKVLEAVVSLLMEYVRSGNKFYTNQEGINKRAILTRCEEVENKRQWHVAVGNFRTFSLDTFYYRDDSEFVGLGGLRKCFNF